MKNMNDLGKLLVTLLMIGTTSWYGFNSISSYLDSQREIPKIVTTHTDSSSSSRLYVETNSTDFNDTYSSMTSSTSVSEDFNAATTSTSVSEDLGSATTYTDPNSFNTKTTDNRQETTSGLPTKEDLAPVGENSGPIELGEATFTPEELQDETAGWINYYPVDHLNRPTGADALLKKAMINTGTSANRAIRPPGFISGPKYDHSRGHLIAKQFGESGDNPQNLVTLYQYPVNDPYMNYYELAIRHALNKNETIRYRVIPEYSGETLIPERIILEAKGLASNTTINFKIAIPNKK